MLRCGRERVLQQHGHVSRYALQGNRIADMPTLGNAGPCNDIDVDSSPSLDEQGWDYLACTSMVPWATVRIASV